MYLLTCADMLHVRARVRMRRAAGSFVELALFLHRVGSVSHAGCRLSGLRQVLSPLSHFAGSLYPLFAPVSFSSQALNQGETQPEEVLSRILRENEERVSTHKQVPKTVV